MQRVEKHIVKTNDYKELAIKSKELYNQTLYYLRQMLFKKIEWCGEYDLTKLYAEFDEEVYRNLPIQTSQQIVKLCFKNWKSWLKALKEYERNPAKFEGKPRIPKYKKELSVIIFTNQQVKLKDNLIHFPKFLNLKPISTGVSNIAQVRILPRSNHFVVEVVYNVPDVELLKDNNRYLGIDIGLGNLAACVSNVTNAFIVNGKPLKSINQYFNKHKAIAMSYIGGKGVSNRTERLAFKRNNKIQDYLHKSSRIIINKCIKDNINTIIIGKNKQWKTNINIGKRNNQSFVSVPFSTLIEQIKYKAEDVGINVKITEESYTSKCSALDLEQIKKHLNYLGKRIKRGLFKTATGLLINADINSGLNILRKEVGDAFMPADRGLVLNPIRINIF